MAVAVLILGDGHCPVPATHKALERAGLKLDDIDLIESMKPSPRKLCRDQASESRSEQG